MHMGGRSCLTLLDYQPL